MKTERWSVSPKFWAHYGHVPGLASLIRADTPPPGSGIDPAYWRSAPECNRAWRLADVGFLDAITTMAAAPPSARPPAPTAPVAPPAPPAPTREARMAAIADRAYATRRAVFAAACRARTPQTEAPSAPAAGAEDETAAAPRALNVDAIYATRRAVFEAAAALRSASSHPRS